MNQIEIKSNQNNNHQNGNDSLIKKPLIITKSDADFFERVKFIGIVYSKADRKFFPTEEAYLAEAEVFQRANILSDILEKWGINTKLYLGDEKLLPKILRDKPDIILNLVDSVRGLEILATCIPAILDLSQTSYTGCGIYAFILSTNKVLIKELLESSGIPTPKYQLVRNWKEEINPELKYPLITKLNNYNGSVGITNDAVSENERHLRKRLRWLTRKYKRPVIIEEFTGEREVSAIVLEGPGGRKSVYMGEKIFNPTKKRKHNFCSYEASWVEENAYNYVKFESKEIENYSKLIFDLMNMADYAKYDIRLDSEGKPFFIDCNPNPALGPKSTDCAIANITSLYDISFNEVLIRILKSALVTSPRVESKL